MSRINLCSHPRRQFFVRRFMQPPPSLLILTTTTTLHFFLLAFRITLAVPLDFRSRLMWQAVDRRLVVEQSASATHAPDAVVCAAAHRETRHNRSPAIASTWLWPPDPAVPPASPTRPARLRQKDLAESATYALVSALADGWAVLHRYAMPSPDDSRIPLHRVTPAPRFDSH